MRNTKKRFVMRFAVFALLTGALAFSGCQQDSQPEQGQGAGSGYELEVMATSIADGTLYIGCTITDHDNQPLDSPLLQEPGPEQATVGDRPAFFSGSRRYDYETNSLFFILVIGEEGMDRDAVQNLTVSDLVGEVYLNGHSLDFDVYQQLQHSLAAGLPVVDGEDHGQWELEFSRSSNDEELRTLQLLNEELEADHWSFPGGGLNHSAADLEWLTIDQVAFFDGWLYANMLFDPKLSPVAMSVFLAGENGEQLENPSFTRYGADGKTVEFLIPVESEEALAGVRLLLDAHYSETVLEETLTTEFVIGDPEEKRVEGPVVLGEGSVLDEIVVTKLHVSWRGTGLYDGQQHYWIELELADGSIFYDYSGSSMSSSSYEEIDGQVYDRFTYSPGGPIPLEDVAAVILNDVRIPLD